MKQTTISGKDLLLIELPKGVVIIQGLDDSDAVYYLELIVNNDEDFIMLPPGSYQFLFADPLKPTTEECKGVVDVVEIKNEPTYYTLYDGSEVLATTDAIRSWESFVISQGFEHPEKVIALVKTKPSPPVAS